MEAFKSIHRSNYLKYLKMIFIFINYLVDSLNKHKIESEVTENIFVF